MAVARYRMICFVLVYSLQSEYGMQYAGQYTKVFTMLCMYAIRSSSGVCLQSLRFASWMQIIALYSWFDTALEHIFSLRILHLFFVPISSAKPIQVKLSMNSFRGCKEIKLLNHKMAAVYMMTG